MLAPHCLRRLTLDPAEHPRGQPHLSSASGLVCIGRNVYVVADDEHHLVQFDGREPAASPLRLIRFAPGTLPADPARRKAAKPDLETLIHFPAGPEGEGLIVAWGSCSRPQRERAFVFPIDAHGGIAVGPRELSLSELCGPLRESLGELNLEAAFVRGDRLHVFQRAHGGQPFNGHISFPVGAMHAWLCGRSTHPPQPLEIEAVDLGSIDGVPLGITDAAVLPDGGGWLFSAVAENTSDAYADGACVGSVIGWADEQNRVQRCERLHGAPKVEGLALVGQDRLWLVTDADDPGRASELLEIRDYFGRTL
jgi:hypothetical protein